MLTCHHSELKALGYEGEKKTFRSLFILKKMVSGCLQKLLWDDNDNNRKQEAFCSISSYSCYSDDDDKRKKNVIMFSTVSSWRKW